MNYGTNPAEAPEKPTRAFDSQSWALGTIDAFYNRPSRDHVKDPLAYSSGRVEGEAWRLANLNLSEQLKKNRVDSLHSTVLP
jgi:hypothetical protein